VLAPVQTLRFIVLVVRLGKVSIRCAVVKSVFRSQRVKGSLRRAAPALDALGRLAKGSGKARRSVRQGVLPVVQLAGRL
jgi:hypothetical protein